MGTGLHQPRFKLIHLVVLVAVVGVVFGIVPAPHSVVVAGIIVLGAFLSSITDRINPIEWIVLTTIGVVLYCLMIPAVSSGPHLARTRALTTTTTPSTVPTPIKVP